MTKASMRGLRIVGLLAITLMAAHCGDSDVNVTTESGVGPSAGTFTGTLDSGGAILIEVGSIDEIRFDCDGEDIHEKFLVPREIKSNGTFDVTVTDGGREFRVIGVFRNNNIVDGHINDPDDRCDDGFEASRSGVVITPTVVRTPTPTGPAPTVEPTNGDGLTPTPVVTGSGGESFTATPTPIATSTPSNACPVGVEVVSDAGGDEVLDTGWTGIAHHATVIQDGKLTFQLDCTPATRPCGVCQVSGPIPNAKAGAGDIESQRCSNDTAIKCNNTTPCPTGKGPCVFFYGAPLPLSAGGVSTCVVNQVDGSISGTANIESGAFQTSINLTSSVYAGLKNEQPCPVCSGDSTPNDTTTKGTCSEGQHIGAACDTNGRSPIPSFGNTSLDCPPNSDAIYSSLNISLSGSGGTETRTLTASSFACTGVVGKKCFCDDDGGVPTKPNACTPNASACSNLGNNQGGCDNVVEQKCKIEKFRGCTTNAECPASGDECVATNRPCYLDLGVVDGSVSAIGKESKPTNGIAKPTFASLFCVPSVAQQSVNIAAGLAGLGRLQLPLVTKEILP